MTKIHLSGSTLVETLSSMALLGLLFVLGSQLFQSMSGLGSPMQKFKTQQIVNTWLAEPLPAVPLNLEEKEISGRNCFKEIVPLAKNENWIRITVSCYDDAKLLEERSRLIPQTK